MGDKKTVVSAKGEKGIQALTATTNPIKIKIMLS